MLALKASVAIGAMDKDEGEDSHPHPQEVTRAPDLFPAYYPTFRGKVDA